MGHNNFERNVVSKTLPKFIVKTTKQTEQSKDKSSISFPRFTHIKKNAPMDKTADL